jgi:hypothetical protein
MSRVSTERRPQGQECVPREQSVRIGLDAITAARLTLRAEEAGTSVGEYVRSLIAKDGSRGLADALAAEQLEVQLFTAILVRAVLAAAVGREEIEGLTERAKEKATEQARVLLAGLPAPGPRS